MKTPRPTALPRFEPLESRLLLSATDVLQEAALGTVVPGAPAMLATYYFAPLPYNGKAPALVAAAPAAAPGAVVTGRIVTVSGQRQLQVMGTSRADAIMLTGYGGVLTLYGGPSGVVFAQPVSSVVIYGFGGDDSITLTCSVQTPVTAYGGDGDDSLYDAGQAADKLYGEAGDDLLVSVSGRQDTVYGGAGLDSYWVDANETLADLAAQENAANSVHRISGFYQPWTADRNSPDYVALEPGGGSLKDPTVTADAVGYRNFASKPLFVNGANYNDIAQGAMGDCYYLASLASLADRNPMVIKQLIAPLGDGSYAVRFYRNGQPVYLRIDGDLPVNRYGGLAYAGLGRGGETWVPLVEKAYAFFRYGQNSYASLNGGWMSDAYQHVTGKGAASYYAQAASNVMYNFLSQNLAAGRAVTAGSVSKPTAGPIVGGHAYMIKSVSGGNYVTLYNPWGVDGKPADSNPGDGLVTLSIAQFMQCFSIITLSLA